jgi:hypothetical protein
MMMTSRLHAGLRAVASALTAAGVVYGINAAIVWCRYGHASEPHADERDGLLDRFIPCYDVVERHSVRIAAPPEITLAASKEQDLFNIAPVRAIFKAREVVLRAVPDDRNHPRGLLATVRALGWGVLAEVPGREIVLGAVTKPWEANVIFRSLPPDEFATFAEPGHVKIVWTLRADAAGDNESVFRTETRAIATDAAARERFRRYWAFTSPGIALIRRLSLNPLRREAERRAVGARLAATAGSTG